MLDVILLRFIAMLIIVDIDECSSPATDPCVRGSCVNTPGSVECNCTGTGYEGPMCEDGKSRDKSFRGFFLSGVTPFHRKLNNRSD